MKTISLEKLLDIEDSELKKIISFISPEIHTFEITTKNIILHTNDNCNIDEIFANFNFLTQNYFNHEQNTEIIFDTSTSYKKTFFDYEKLEYSGLVRKIEDGLISFSGSAVKLYKYFDNIFCNLSKSINAIEKKYPVLLPINAYNKTGYSKSSPQYSIYCCDLHENIKDLKNVQDDPYNVQEFLSKPKFVLSPSACFHVYEEYENKTLDRNTIISFSQKTFRNEGRFNWDEIGRLKDYTIREIVFIGDNDYVNKIRMKIIELTCEIINKLQLSCRIASSADPFIIPKMQMYKKVQIVEKSKYEARLNINDDDDIACASFNLHGISFTKAFKIHVKDTIPTVTGCVGFGIERWVLAFLCQHGTDEKLWPISID